MRATVISGLLVSISLVALTACSGGQAKGIESTKASAPIPPITTTESTLTENDTLTPMTTVTTTTTSMPESLATPPMVNSVATLPPTTGNSTIEERMAKLEHAVGSLRTDYDRIMPAFASLNTTNERIQTLLDEIEDQGGVVPKGAAATKTTETTVVTKHAPVPGSVSVPPKETKIVETKTTEVVTPSPEVMEAMAGTTTTTTTTTSVAATETVKGVRIGEHGSKTRLVIDLTGKTKPEVSYDLDNAEKLLLVDMPGASWAGDKSGAPKSSAFITGWSVQEGAKGGSNLAVQLKKDAKILSTEYLKAQGKDPARLVVDIGPAS